MKYILLTKNKKTLVDDQCFEQLNKHNWFCNGGYARRYSSRTDGKRHVIHMHRVITKAPKNLQVDHINGDKLDNRIENLRLCTNSLNMANKPAQKNNTSGFKGVSKHKGTNKWQAVVAVKGKNKYLGIFKTKKQAYSVYKKAAVNSFGVFAYIS